MSLIANLKSLFTRQRVARIITVAPPVLATVADTFFPEAQRGTWDSPLVPVSEITSEVGVAPVVHRDGQPVLITGDAESVDYIVPLPIYLEANVTAQDLNNLKVWKVEQRQAWADRKIQQIRQRVKLTIEALCAQAVFNGRINHPLLSAGGRYQRYTVSYGGHDIQSVAVVATAKWDHAEASLVKVYELLEEMGTALSNAGYAGETETFAGKAAYARLLALVGDRLINPDKVGVPATLGKNEINLGGHTIRKMAETYKDPGTGQVVSKIPEKEIRMTAKGYTSFLYTALDDLAAGLEANPLFIDTVEEKRPSRIIITGQSKPLPAVAPRATCKALVLS